MNRHLEMYHDDVHLTRRIMASMRNMEEKNPRNVDFNFLGSSLQDEVKSLWQEAVMCSYMGLVEDTPRLLQDLDDALINRVPKFSDRPDENTCPYVLIQHWHQHTDFDELANYFIFLQPTPYVICAKHKLPRKYTLDYKAPKVWEQTFVNGEQITDDHSDQQLVDWLSQLLDKHPVNVRF